MATANFSHNIPDVASRTSTGTVDTTHYTRDPADRILAARDATGTQYDLTDGLGSVMAVADPAGTILASYTYGPFGETQQTDGPLAAVNPWRYAGTGASVVAVAFAAAPVVIAGIAVVAVGYNMLRDECA